MKYEFESKYSTGQVVYVLIPNPEEPCRVRCEHCGEFCLNKNRTPIIAEARIIRVTLQGVDDWCDNRVAIDKPTLITYLLDLSYLATDDKIFLTREEAEQNLTNERAWIWT